MLCVSVMFARVRAAVYRVCALGTCVLVCVEARGWHGYLSQSFSTSSFETRFLIKPRAHQLGWAGDSLHSGITDAVTTPSLYMHADDDPS